uniref:Uncharacterized protein n=1 Tax=Macaca mulatta TaxID=9544 RepID=F6WIM9_MACMU
MVQAPSPIHSHVRLLLIKFHSTCHRTTSRQLTELKQAVEYWTVLTKVESLHLLAVLRHVIWTDGAQEFNVVVAMVLGHLLSIGFVRAHRSSNRLSSRCPASAPSCSPPVPTISRSICPQKFLLFIIKLNPVIK